MNAIVPATLEQVLITGDLSKLSPQDRIQYYTKVCESVGLNPLTKPFEYITLNGKLTLYALRACTDQLRSIHGVSIEEMVESEREGVFIVTVKAKNKDGRTDMAKGAVTISGLKGEALANAMMKAETKAKRRATLSLCGLGFLDETEVETIPGAKIMPQEMPTVLTASPEVKADLVKPSPVPAAPAPEPEIVQGQEPAAPPALPDKEFARHTFDLIWQVSTNAKDPAEIDETMKANAKGLKVLERFSAANYNKLKVKVTEARAALAAKTDGFVDDELPA